MPEDMELFCYTLLGEVCDIVTQIQRFNYCKINHYAKDSKEQKKNLDLLCEE